MQNRKKSSQKLTIFYTAFFLLTACSSGADFKGKPAASSTQSTTSSIAAPGSDAVAAPPTAAPTEAPTAVPTAAAETKVAPKFPPTAAELVVHNGPLEDTVEVYVNGVLNGKAQTGHNVVRVIVKAEGEVHYWSYNILVKGATILSESKAKWVDGTIPFNTILSDKTVEFEY
ncbi:MAG: hypothetical protein WCI18_11790 [Pseudomonadota bacterium]